jgi:hypothetical protein
MASDERRWVMAVLTCPRCVAWWPGVYESRWRVLECPFCRKFTVVAPMTAVLLSKVPRQPPPGPSEPPRVPWLLTLDEETWLRRMRIDPN